jgi:hypothetical protein
MAKEGVVIKVHFGIDGQKLIGAINEKGFLSITSSYGNYSYIWSAMGEGTTLRQFFLTANNQYLSDKFFHDRHKEKYAFDLDLAFVEMKKDLFENRRNGGFSSEQAREVFNDIKDWQEWSDSGMSEERFYTEYFDRREISKWAFRTARFILERE